MQLRNKGEETLAFQSQSHPPERLAKTERLPLFDFVYFTSEMRFIGRGFGSGA
jgi:hypothetical protein